MALGVLNIFYIVLGVIGVGLQGFLYFGNEKFISNRVVFILNMLFGIIISYLVFTSLPSNYSLQRIMAILIGLISILAMIVRVKDISSMVAKIMLSISVIGGLIQLFM